MAKSCCAKCGRATGQLLLLLLLSLIGGCLYRVRGGWGDWGDWNKVFGDNVLTHDMFGRFFAWALPLALFVFALSRSACSGLIVSLSILVLTYFGIMVGWGTYFGIGNEPWVAGDLGRVGVFDWLVGPRLVCKTMYVCMSRSPLPVVCYCCLLWW